MYHRTKLCFFLAIYSLILFSCHSNSTENSNTDIVADPSDIGTHAAKKISVVLDSADTNNGKVDDSTQLMSPGLIKNFYSQNRFLPVWSNDGTWEPVADSLFAFINNAKLHGLFPEDYHAENLISLKYKVDKDSLSHLDSRLWAKTDVLLTDALIKIIKDLKYGRLQNDSLAFNKDSILGNEFYLNNLQKIVKEKQFTAVLNAVQPKHNGYWELKNGIKDFLDSIDTKKYTYVAYPYKKGSAQDSIIFSNALRKRLSESGCVEPGANITNTAELSAAIKRFQAQKGLKEDGKISTALIKIMNMSDAEKFKRIAITLDKYKQLPEDMPEKYIWVNLPGYYLQVWDNNSMVLYSNIICGRPETKTPLLTSDITDMITYPTWTVPTSIIVKQYLPRLRNNPNYLSRIGLHLINNKGEKIDPGSVNWGKYSKGIPYAVRQSSGDNNALGVMKFNFNNPYSVYLHDTNQRYLFKNSYRALSHGCVRVQEWEKLAFYIASNDSINNKTGASLNYNTDSIKNWLSRKSHRMIQVKNKIPLFIKYFTCESKNGKIEFYDDMYGEDKNLREKYFSNK